MKLLITQKNTLFELIVEGGLSPNSFDISEYQSKNSGEINTKLVYKGSDYKFEFRTFAGKHSIHWQPALKIYSHAEAFSGFDNTVKIFKMWVMSVRQEISATDKWERLTEEIKNISVTYENESEKFSATEFEELRTQMLLLKTSIRNINLLPEQLSAVEGKVDDLIELAKHLNKFDWKSLFVGTIVSIIIQLGITPENAKAIWATIKTIFSRYFLLP